MDTSFASVWQDLLKLGLIDDQYPLPHSSVQLPNGWYGINSIISGLSSILTKYEYDEMLLPTISVSTVFKSIPDRLKGSIEQLILPITHTGLHKLDNPYYLSGRPDLIIPQIIQTTARSYRDLPVRLIQKGFRYLKSVAPVDVSLVTDTEYPALDAIGIFSSEAEYLGEIEKLVSEIQKFLAENLKLSTFSTHDGLSKLWWSVLPNGSVIEVARLREFGKELSEAIDFKVLLASNTPGSPYILNFSVTARLFAAVVAAHGQPGKVVLPVHTLRAFGMSYGVDISGLARVRIDQTKLPFTPERFAKLLREGGLFALLPAEEGGGGKVELRWGEERSEKVEVDQIEEKVLSEIVGREERLAGVEKAVFEERVATAVKFVGKGTPIPEGFLAIGEKVDDSNVVVVARPFMLQ